MSEHAKELGALELTVNNLERAVQERLDRIRRRARITTGLIFFVAIAMTVYLSVAYKYIAEYDAQVMAMNLQHEIELALPQAQKELTATLTARAPEDVALAMDYVTRFPEWANGRINSTLVKEMNKEIRKLDEQVYPNLKLQMVELRDRIEREHPNATPEEKADLVLDEIAKFYGAESRKAIDSVYGDVQTDVYRAVNYLKKLSKGVDLDRQQQIERELFQTLFALIDKWERQSAETNKTSPLFNDNDEEPKPQN